jgi:HK97 family phage major capsid protein
MEEKVLELQKLIKELREKWEAKEKGLYTKAEFEEFQKKINERIEQLETMIKRPPVADGGKDAGQPSEKKAAFFKFMREGKAALTPEEAKALVSDATGQILIPEELEAEIYRELPKLTIIRSLATVRQIRTDRIRRRSLTEITVGWGKLETGTAITESTMVPSEEYQYVEDLYGLTKIGEDELMDTDIALESIVTDSFSRAIAEAEDTAFVVGTGHANKQPEGILNGSVVARVDAGQAGAITADDILKLIYAVPAQYRQNGVLIMNSKTELALRLLKSSDGQYLWQPSLQAGRPNTFAGYPIYNQEDIPEIPAAGTAADVVIFGDVRAGYRILDRLGMTVQRLTELYAEAGLVGFKVHRRVGGGVIRPNALRILRVPA